MEELVQLYDENCNQIAGKSATKKEALSKGLLHASSHVWIYRKVNHFLEFLIQRRASNKRTWPNMLDVSVAGHVEMGEAPEGAAVREAKEEIGLSISVDDLIATGTHRTRLVAKNGIIENEIQFLFVLELQTGEDFELKRSEVSSIDWVPLNKFKASYNGDDYVPHGDDYYQKVINGILNQ